MTNGREPASVELRAEPDSQVLHLRGSWRLRDLDELSSKLRAVRLTPERPCLVDGSGLREVDTAGAMIVLRTLSAAGCSEVRLRGLSHAHQSIFSLVEQCIERPQPLRADERSRGFAALGKGVFELGKGTQSILGFIGAVAVDGARSLLVPARLRTKELVVQLERAGLQAIPIVSLVTALIGIVVAYLSAQQLERYGANVFLVDGIAIAMCRELSPILVAILVAGRSGSAFTAQIGTMKLNEEVDAISTLGLSPMRVLVLPRIFALIIAMPILVVVGDIAGIVGGMVIGDLRLGVSIPTFIERLQVVLPLKHVIIGLIKAPVFAFFVGVIGCRRGLNVENNATSVGENTTRTVVQSVVAVILLNAGFAVIFSELGL